MSVTDHHLVEELLAVARTVAAEDLPEFLGTLERVKVIAMMRLMPAPAQPERDEQIDIVEAATMLGFSKDYLYRNHHRFSFTRREGRKLLFSRRGIEEHIAQKRPLATKR